MRYIDPRSNKALDFYCQRRRWRQLPLDALTALILEFRRRSAIQHYSPAEWHELDLMRRHHARLSNEAVR